MAPRRRRPRISPLTVALPLLPRLSSKSSTECHAVVTDVACRPTHTLTTEMALSSSKDTVTKPAFAVAKDVFTRLSSRQHPVAPTAPLALQTYPINHLAPCRSGFRADSVRSTPTQSQNPLVGPGSLLPLVPFTDPCFGPCEVVPRRLARRKRIRRKL